MHPLYDPTMEQTTRFIERPREETLVQRLEGVLDDHTLTPSQKEAYFSDLVPRLESIYPLLETNPSLYLRLTTLNSEYKSSLQLNFIVHIGNDYPVEKSKKILSSLISLAPEKIITEEKITLCELFESALSETQKEQLAHHLINTVDFTERTPYYALIQDANMQKIFAKNYIHSNSGSENWLDSLADSIHPAPCHVPFITALLSHQNSGNEYINWLDWNILSVFNKFKTNTAGYIFLNLSENCISNLVHTFKTEFQFIANALNFVFLIEPDVAKNLTILAATINGFEEFSHYHSFLNHLIETNSPVVLYLHCSLEMDAYATQLNQANSEKFLYAWHGNLHTKRTVINFILQNNARVALLETCVFPQSDNDLMYLENESEIVFQSTEGLSLSSFQQHRNTNDLDSIKNRIQKIPPLLVALGMNLPEYQAWLPKFVPYFTREQIEACCMYLPAENLGEWLQMFYINLDSQNLSLVIDSVPGDIRPFIYHHIGQLSQDVANLDFKILNWWNTHHGLEKLTHDPDAFYNAKLKLINDSIEIVTLMKLLNTHKMRHYIQSHNTILTAAYARITPMFLEITRKRAELQSSLSTQHFQDNGYDQFSDEYLEMLSLANVNTLGMITPKILIDSGISSDKDLKQLGLSPKKTKVINQLVQKFDSFGKVPIRNRAGEVVAIISMRNLLNMEYVRNDNKGNLLENAYCANMHFSNTEVSKTTLYHILSIIEINFKKTAQEIFELQAKLYAETNITQQRSVFKQALKYCVHFTRTHHIDYILFHQVLKDTYLFSQDKIQPEPN